MKRNLRTMQANQNRWVYFRGRIISVFFIAGAALIIFGAREFIVSHGTSPEPVETDLSLIEKDGKAENIHLKIGEHWAIYSACVYEYEVEKGKDSPDISSKVNYLYYPIISDMHPFLVAIRELQTIYNSLEDVPDSEWPAISHIPILVKTKEFKTVGDIPEDWLYEDSITGLVINRISSLSGEDRKLIQESFPNADLTEVLILEKNRTPFPLMLAMAIVIGGIVLVFAGIAFIVMGKTTSKKPINAL